MEKENKIEIKTERIMLAEIYKQDGKIYIDFPYDKDVYIYELYGFLRLYLENLEIDLINSMEKI